MKQALSKYAAEFVGAFTLCFVGILAINHLGDAVDGLGLIGVALAHGLAIGVMIGAVGSISGGHLNPAVTIGLFCAGKIDWRNAMAYVVSQCLGGLTAAVVVLPIVGGVQKITDGTPWFNPISVSVADAMIVEAVLTFFLVFVVYGAAVDKRGSSPVAGLFIGLTVTLDILAGGPITGGAMNPARHLGPALVSGDAGRMAQIWLYWLAPVSGGVVAALLWRFLLEKKNPA